MNHLHFTFPLQVWGAKFTEVVLQHTGTYRCVQKSVIFCQFNKMVFITDDTIRKMSMALWQPQPPQWRIINFMRGWSVCWKFYWILSFNSFKWLFRWAYPFTTDYCYDAFVVRAYYLIKWMWVCMVPCGEQTPWPALKIIRYYFLSK